MRADHSTTFLPDPRTFQRITRALATGMFVLLSASRLQAQDTGSWNREAARTYLDGRMNWWTTWPEAARDHQTFCISCHTVLPYALGRQSLRGELGEKAASPLEDKLVENVTKRVRTWNEVEPFYADAKAGVPKTVESRGTESILDALILVWREGKVRMRGWHWKTCGSSS
ncbi:MAG: hypothetical protein JWP08_3119 [Bryobacterales bacterium]|nr:hypothetical protein [Bryobacterales bacterium]